MLRLAADENVDQRLLTGLARRLPFLDLVRVRDAGLGGMEDPEILEWAAREGRLLITQDVQTLVGFAWERVSRGLPMPGVVVFPMEAALAPAIEDLAIIADLSQAGEWEGQVLYLPLTSSRPSR